jgi:hypothetical protein
MFEQDTPDFFDSFRMALYRVAAVKAGRSKAQVEEEQ